ncbi:hypothetical protein [Hydrogenimonas sp. SS33]|uniref:hypothetical protein n=1 Tax=Hydrogenimonas leucolamina TaxID=2954236 RepID=UPI00336BDCB3
MKKRWLTLLTALSLSAFAGSLPDYKTLCADFPDVSGWKITKCDGMKMTNPMFGEVVTATKSYTKGGSRADISILSGMQAMMMWAPYQSGTTMESDDELMKVETIDGFPVGIGYNKKDRSGGVVVQIAPNAVLAVTFTDMSWKEALELAKRFDWKKLHALFQ